MKWPRQQKKCRHRSQVRRKNRAIPSATDNFSSVTEPTLVLVPRTKYQHGSAGARCLTRHFPPAPFAAALRYTDYAGCSRSFRRSQIAETGMDSGGHSRWKMVGSLRSWIVCSRCSKNKWVGFFVKDASFSSPFSTAHRVPSTISRLVTASPKTPARHCVAPSEDYFHAGGPEARLFREQGDRRMRGEQCQKKRL